MTVFPKVLQLLKEKNMNDVLLTGCIIPVDDMQQLQQMSVGKLFAPGTLTKEIAGYITEWVTENRPF